MDLRAKSLVVSKWLELVLRFRWPVILFLAFPVLHLLQFREGLVVSAFLGSIHTYGIFPWTSGEHALAQAWFQGSAWFALLPWAIWLLVLAWRYHWRILPLALLSGLLLLGASWLEYWPWLSIGGASFFASFAFARLYAPVSLFFAMVFSSVLGISLIQEILDLLRLNHAAWLPFMVGAYVCMQSLTLDLSWQRFKAWQAGQQARESLVKSTQKIYQALVYASFASLAVLVSYPAQGSDQAWSWVIASTLLSVGFCILFSLLWPALQSILPLADRRLRK